MEMRRSLLLWHRRVLRDQRIGTTTFDGTLSGSLLKNSVLQQERQRCFSNRKKGDIKLEGEGDDTIDKFRIEPRSLSEITTTSLKGVWSMMKSQDSFDAFLDRYRNNLINLKELNIIEAMALHHDLNEACSVLLRHNFNILEFVDGAHLAVEAFLNIKESMQQELLDRKQKATNADQKFPFFVEELTEEDQIIIQKAVKDYLGDNSLPSTARLEAMVTPLFFSSCCYSSVSMINNRTQANISKGTRDFLPVEYKVMKTALLNIRSSQPSSKNDEQLFRLSGDDFSTVDLFEKEQRKAETVNQILAFHEDPRLAQIDVLCRYSVCPKTHVREEKGDGTVTNSSFVSSKRSDTVFSQAKNDKQQYTCAVTFMGWFYGTSTPKWKICDLKDTTF